MTTDAFNNAIYYDDLCLHPSIGSAKKSLNEIIAPKPFNLNPKSVTASARQNDNIKVSVKDRHSKYKDKKRRNAKNQSSSKKSGL